MIDVAAQRELEARRAQLGEQGFATMLLDGSQVADADAFLAAAGEQLFGGEPVTNWDSFADVLLNRVSDQPSDKVVLLWSRADAMLAGDLAGLLVAADVLFATTRRLAPGRTFDAVMLGEGEAFG